MAQIDVVLLALAQGQSVRRDGLEPITRIFVLSDILNVSVRRLETVATRFDLG
jgi:hypothetical protein